MGESHDNLLRKRYVMIGAHMRKLARPIINSVPPALNNALGAASPSHIPTIKQLAHESIQNQNIFRVIFSIIFNNKTEVIKVPTSC